MNDRKDVEKLLKLIEEGTSPFHVVANTKNQLKEAGFTEINLKEPWVLTQGGSYYMEHHGSSLIAFTIGSEEIKDLEFRIAAAHTDFPTLRIKTNPELVSQKYQQLNVEVYGGVILNTWLDRPLSIAGRVARKSEEVFRPKMELVDLKKPILTIPNLAIHLNKEVNKGVELNRQKDMLPLLGIEKEEAGKYFQSYLAKHLGVETEEILDFELGVYPVEEGMLIGLEEEFISAPRLDNLTSVQALITGLIDGKRNSGVNVAAFFDHEEIGSKTKQGAGSMLLSTVLEKIMLSLGGDRLEFLNTLEDSLLLSVDVGHGLHPNQADKTDPTNKNVLGDGICLKEACAQSYATDSEAVAMLQQVCEAKEITYQKFVNRSDGTSGSTLGSIASAMVPIRTVEIGVPLLAMHSARELMGRKDQEELVKVVTAFYEIEEEGEKNEL